MNQPAVIELQILCTDESTSSAVLLKKALIVARKLKLNDFSAWVENELSGYKEKVPEYRKISGHITAYDPFKGWLPIQFNSEMSSTFNTYSMNESVSELEELYNSGTAHHGSYVIELQGKAQEIICKLISANARARFEFEKPAIVKIIDSVKLIILNWALKLEEDGILGEGLIFSNQEKQNATTIPQNINYFFGPIGNAQVATGDHPVISGAITQTIDIGKLSELLDSITSSLKNLDLDPIKEKELDSEIRTIRAQIESPAPKQSIITECLSSVRKILENTGGSLAAGIVIELGKYYLGR